MWPTDTPPQDDTTHNGGLLASLVAAGAGCATMGLAYAGSAALPAMGRWLTWYAPSGALSGMSGITVLVWVLIWALLYRTWSARTLQIRGPLLLALGLLLIGVLLTFPPIARLL